ncbi:thioesterase [Myxococcus fulvus]|uniref:Thioesterase n=2 Tax=Myxococcus fulvus TaxID=33 RepID=A0A511T0B7_MYXFU|nr:acyl-CoA thioesterase [Myxococcus fulvus]GEN07297.1 thioesterase [Myxococcus fulvus]
MNLYLRMLWVLLSSLWKPQMKVDALTSTLQQRVLPNDLDLNLHMNNGRFLTVCDLNRVDLFVRTGLAALMMKNKWAPIIVRHTMDYKKALPPFRKYTVSMTISRWDEKYFYATHQFISNGKVVAEGESTAVILGKQGVIAPAQVIEAVNARQGRAEALQG